MIFLDFENDSRKQNHIPLSNGDTLVFNREYKHLFGCVPQSCFRVLLVAPNPTGCPTTAEIGFVKRHSNGEWGAYDSSDKLLTCHLLRKEAGREVARWWTMNHKQAVAS